MLSSSETVKQPTGMHISDPIFQSLTNLTHLFPYFPHTAVFYMMITNIRPKVKKIEIAMINESEKNPIWRGSISP